MGVPKVVRNATFSIIGLLALFVGAGVAYTKFISPNGAQPAASKAPSTAQSQAIKPVKPAENAKESASVQTITSPVAVGSNASIYIKTNAGSNCKISVIYNGNPSTDSGLAPKVADDYGTVTWTWSIGNDVPIGTWPVNVSCVYNGRSAVVSSSLQVTN